MVLKQMVSVFEHPLNKWQMQSDLPYQQHQFSYMALHNSRFTLQIALHKGCLEVLQRTFINSI
jgi:hypothetical protein